MRPSQVSRAFACIVAVVGVLATVPTQAAYQNAWSLEVLVDGRPITEYAARGKTYVEAIEGREYTLRLRNHTGERVAVALSVDGLNTIDAKTTPALHARKWILGPYQTVDLSGWQTSASTARHFFFTTEERSYGAWLGKTSNLGLISAAVFRERRLPPPPIGVTPRDQRYDEQSGHRQRKDGPAYPSARAPEAESRVSQDSKMAAKRAEESDELAATGIGSEYDHRVQRVDFEPESSPAAVLEIRYEYRDALVALGVLPRPCDPTAEALARRERARGFVQADFAPDPYRRGCR